MGVKHSGEHWRKPGDQEEGLSPWEAHQRKKQILQDRKNAAVATVFGVEKQRPARRNDLPATVFGARSFRPPQLWNLFASGKLVYNIWKGGTRLDMGPYPRIIRKSKDFRNMDGVKEEFPGDSFCVRQSKWRLMEGQRAKDSTWARVKILVEEGIGVTRIARAFGLDTQAIIDKAVAEQWPHPLSDISPIPLVESPLDMLPNAEQERVETILTQKLLMDHWETIGARFRAIMMGVAAKGAKEALKNPPAVKTWADVERVERIGRAAAGIDQQDRLEVARVKAAGLSPAGGLKGQDDGLFLTDPTENEEMGLFDVGIIETADHEVQGLGTVEPDEPIDMEVEDED
jgi:hypothetical protein